jgi:hypothetical protein
MKIAAREQFPLYPQKAEPLQGIDDVPPALARRRSVN